MARTVPLRRHAEKIKPAEPRLATYVQSGKAPILLRTEQFDIRPR